MIAFPRPTLFLALACLLLIMPAIQSQAQSPGAESAGSTDSISTDSISAANAPTTPPPRSGPNGGTLRTISGMHLETTVDESGIKIFITSQDGDPLSIKSARGAASLLVSGESKRFRYDLLPAEKGVLTAPINLSRLSGRQVDLDIQLFAMPSSSRIRYRETAGVPPSEAQKAASAIARQRTCPVTKKRLGSMGVPVAVTVEDQTIYVCCEGCRQTAITHFDKFTKPALLIKIAASSPSDAKRIDQQAKCPVMDEPLGSMGQPVKVTIGDKPVFLCCKGCLKKLESDPALYLARAYPTHATNRDAEKSPHRVPPGVQEVRPGVFKAGLADKAFYQAQRLCPVMDEPLEAMGGPFRVNANGKAIYICCPGCAKKIDAEPERYLTLLRSKGISPPDIIP